MKKKLYFLSTCSTCLRIIKELKIGDEFEKQDIRTKPISANQLAEMKNLSGSFESLFSRKAMKYRELGLAQMQLSEDDYKNLILEHYTFLKRPVFIINDEIFIGNAKNTIAKVNAKINE